MPKITKLCLHLLKLYRKNCGLFFPDTVYIDVIVNDSTVRPHVQKVHTFGEKFANLTNFLT